MSGSEQVAFVDIQGFVVDNYFVLKELCFSFKGNRRRQPCIDDNTFNYHYIFCEPFAWKYVSDMCRKRALWLTAFHHGFYWKQGELSYEKISACLEPLKQNNLIIYVKGAQKVKWLRTLFGTFQIDCRNIEDYGCAIQLSNGARNEHMHSHCNKHQKLQQCALRNIKQIEQWYFNNLTNYHE